MLNLRQIEAFRAILATGTVTGASRLLGISQPSVTRLISDLEVDLGFRLFGRHRRGMTPTDEARLFYADVERSFLGLKELEASAEEIRSHARSRFAFGVTPGAALEFAPAVIAAFSKTHGPIEVETHVSTSNRILDLTRSARVSLAIITPFEPITDVTMILSREFDYVAVMRKDHPLARASGPVDVKQIAEGDLISPPEAFLVSRCKDPAVASEIRKRARITIDVSFPAAAIAKYGLGVALVDPLTALFFRRDTELAVRPFKGAPKYPFILAQPRRLLASRLQEDFIAEVERQLDSFFAD